MSDHDEDPPSDSGLDVDPALAAQMGFASFGAIATGHKKRKFDAVVARPSGIAPAPGTDAPPAVASPSHPPPSSSSMPLPSHAGSGANAIPLQTAPGQSERSVNGRFADGTWDWNALRGGVRDAETGDVGFYDKSFVEDPWEGLEGRGQGG